MSLVIRNLTRPCNGKWFGTCTRNNPPGDRKSTRLNSSHLVISYADFCLKKKSTLHPLPGRLGITHGHADLLPGRLGRGAPDGKAHHLAGRSEHLLLALTPAFASTLALAS